MPHLNETVGDLAELVDNCPAPETVAVALYRGSKLVDRKTVDAAGRAVRKRTVTTSIIPSGTRSAFAV